MFGQIRKLLSILYFIDLLYLFFKCQIFAKFYRSLTYFQNFGYKINSYDICIRSLKWSANIDICIEIQC